MRIFFGFLCQTSFSERCSMDMGFEENFHESVIIYKGFL